MINKTCIICESSYRTRDKYVTSQCCSIDCKREWYKKYAKNGMLQRNEENRLICYGCLQYKNEVDFYTQNGEFAECRNHRASRCKLCMDKASKKVRDRYKTTIEGTLRNRLKSAKNSAKCRGIHFDIMNLTVDYLILLYNSQKGICAVSGQIMNIDCNKCPETLSLDRIDSKKGYEIGNLHLVCWAVNQMKNDFPLQDLIKWCSFIVNNNYYEKAKIEN